MADVIPEVCILPMGPKEFPGFSTEQLQSQFFLQDLPSPERRGCYHYRTLGLRAKTGSVVLFQFDNKIIASAVFNHRERFDPSEDGYHGALYFDVDSIKVFDPVGSDVVHEFWPENFQRFGNVKQYLNAKGYTAFERQLTGIRIPFRPTPKAHDLDAPLAGRIQTTVSRILRDTQLANHVKALHNFECQICGHTIILADGSRYAEGHHIKPLGSPHDGPDVMENIICLCPNHHAACDLAAIHLIPTELRHTIGHSLGQQYIDYHNQTICRVG